ncbi:hypothetical protein EAH_00068370, partial [Eimeria acervulina]
SVAFSVYCQTSDREECKIRRICVFVPAAAALRIEWGMRYSCVGVFSGALEEAVGLLACAAVAPRYCLEDLSGRYLLEWMALHMARRAANVVGRLCSEVEYNGASFTRTCNMKRSCVLKSALDLAAEALRIVWGLGWS